MTTEIHPDVQAIIDANGLGSLPWVAGHHHKVTAVRAVLNFSFDLQAVKNFGLQVLATERRGGWVDGVAGALRHLDRFDADDAREAAAVLRAAMENKQ